MCVCARARARVFVRVCVCLFVSVFVCEQLTRQVLFARQHLKQCVCVCVRAFLFVSVCLCGFNLPDRYFLARHQDINVLHSIYRAHILSIENTFYL